MCYDRLLDEGIATASIPALLRSELRCSLRNGTVAALMIIAVLMFRSAPPWVIAVTAIGALALGTVLHQSLFVLGAAIQRRRASRPT